MPARRIEDLRGNPDEVISQIEDDMSASISKRFGNRAQVLSVLAIMIPSDENNRPRYTIRALQNGAQEFKFTKKGALWFTQTNILDSIGSRTRRNRYHEATGFRQPNTTVAPMLQ
jgi:hypothetical protein